MKNYTIRTEQPRDPEPYFVAMRNPEAFEKYDAEFPSKDKLKLPGQLF